MVSDVGKMVLLGLCLLAGTAVWIVGAITHDSANIQAGSGLVLLVAGYMTGNGVLARRGEAPSPVLVPTPEKVAAAAARTEAAAAVVEAATPAGPDLDEAGDA